MFLSTHKGIWIAVICSAAGFVAGMHSDGLRSLVKCRTIKVSFAGPGNKALPGKVYYPPSLFRKKHPGILFCHGTLPDGKDTAFYTLLNKKLASNGYLILSFDLRGFGKSTKLANIGSIRSINFSDDIDCAISYMLRELPVDPYNLTIAGHSLGANLAFSVGACDKRIRNIIAISAGDFPPIEEYPEVDKRDYLRKLERALNQTVPMKEWERLARPLALFQYLPLPPGKNVLIILADCDASDVLRYNKQLYEQIATHKDLLIIPDSNHNFGFDDFPGNERIAVPALRLLAGGIDGWLASLPSQ